MRLLCLKVPVGFFLQGLSSCDPVRAAQGKSPILDIADGTDQPVEIQTVKVNTEEHVHTSSWRGA
jgi:hypothetical protein